MTTRQMPPQKTLPARYYTDATVFRQEMESFFAQMWICSGRSEEIPKPGDYYLCDVVGESIIVTRDGSGVVRAFYNVCRHRGTRMCREGRGKLSGRIQCPYHGWTYGLDGKLVGAPNMDDASFRREDYPLHSVHCDSWDGFIFLNLSSSPAALSVQLADLPKKFSAWKMGDLRSHKRIAYEVRANWKLIIQNYNECLHCPILHPVLNRVTDYLSGDNDTPQPSYIGGSMEFRAGAETMSTDGKRRRDFLPALSEAQRKQVLYYTLYPNLFLSPHPDYVMAHRLWPRSVDETHIVCEWLFDEKEMSKKSFTADDVIEFWDVTNREDWRISELSQKGISSRAYIPGPYSSHEGLPKAFDRMVLEHEAKWKRGEH